MLTGIRQVEVRDVPSPRITRGDEVLLRVAVVGLCGSDMHYYRTGRIGSQVVQFPWTVGHECSAVVQAVGKDVRRLKVGDRVAVDPLIPCGRCDQCLLGREHTCRNQAFLGCPGQAQGCLSELLVMPEHCCFPVPDAMTMQQAALVEPFAIGLYAARLMDRPRPACDSAVPAAPNRRLSPTVQSACNPCRAPAGRPQVAPPTAAPADLGGPRCADTPIAILGSGPIGLCVLLALRSMGYANIHMTDLRDNRLRLAQQLGAISVAPARPQAGPSVAEQLKRRAPLGFAGVFECAGEQETIDQAIDLLAPGGTLMLVGIPESDRVSFAIDLMRRKELAVQNVRRQNAATADAIALAASGKVALDALATHRLSLDQAPQAFDLVADYRDDVVKAMIVMPGSH